VSVTGMAFWPSMVVVEPFDSAAPGFARAASSSLCRSVSEASEARLPVVAEAFSHLPCSSWAAAAPAKCL
jgi:hypothetical protein